jgi:hypothetical protein
MAAERQVADPKEKVFPGYVRTSNVAWLENRNCKHDCRLIVSSPPMLNVSQR